MFSKREKNSGIMYLIHHLAIKRDFAGGPKFQKMTMPDNMSSY